MMRLIDSQNQEVLLTHVEVARTTWQRFRGLMFRRELKKGFGLWLEPCRSIHTMWMLVPIDVYFIDQDGMIIEHRSHVNPWSIVIPKQKCQTVLETPCASEVLKVGSTVRLQGDS